METSTFITSSTRYFILLLVFPVVFILLPVLPVVFATLVLPEGEVIGKAGGSQYGDILSVVFILLLVLTVVFILLLTVLYITRRRGDWEGWGVTVWRYSGALLRVDGTLMRIHMTVSQTVSVHARADMLTCICILRV